MSETQDAKNPQPTPTPEASTPKAPAPEAPAPKAPTPKAPTPKASTPEASTPKAPAPKASTPKAPTPKAPTPKASTPEAPTPETPTAESSETDSPIDRVKTKLGEVFGSWKVKVGIISVSVIAVVISIFTVSFFWAHIVANQGMKTWSARAGASPIECMIQDTNSDGYVSCSAMLQNEVVPLECGSSIFNIGCRINYGAAASPPARLAPSAGNPAGS
jgi:hypothetical protein